MKIGIFDPYLDTLGGGEKYILTIAAYLAQKHDVSLFWYPHERETITKTVKDRFSLDLSPLSFVESPFSPKKTFLQRVFATRAYDVILFVSDGSIPTLLAKKNILLLQFSVNWVQQGNWKNKLKLQNIYAVICYSQFVKQYIDKTFGIHSIVIPPAILPISRMQKKEKSILTVGRFTKAMNTKKQEMLIDAFKKLSRKNTDWHFILAGSYLPKDKDFITYLQKQADGYPISIKENISQQELSGLYQKAKIYWHAAGYGEDLSVHPERAEHFGITTVEAMSAGCAPVVINAGGQKEIVSDKKNGFLWNTEEELLQKTQALIDNEKLWETISHEAIKRAQDYSEEQFYKHIDMLIGQL